MEMPRPNPDIIARKADLIAHVARLRGTRAPAPGQAAE